jgi:hypothetical protein
MSLHQVITSPLMFVEHEGNCKETKSGNQENDLERTSRLPETSSYGCDIYTCCDVIVLKVMDGLA